MPFFEKFPILSDLFNAHCKKSEHLIIFHIKGFDNSYCKIHSENIWNTIYNKIDKNNEFLYYDSLIQIPFWTVDVTTPDIKKSLINYLKKTNLHNCVYIACYCID